MNIHWKDWCWSRSSNTLVTWCEELTHWKRPWCWGRLKAGGKGDDKGRMRCWMASPTQWTWFWDGKGEGSLVCCSPWGRKESDMTEQLNWTELKKKSLTRTFLDSKRIRVYVLSGFIIITSVRKINFCDKCSLQHWGNKQNYLQQTL